MHIVFVCPQYPPGLSANGVSTYTASMAEELAALGHHISLLCRYPVSGGPPGHLPYGQRITSHPAADRTFRVPILRVAYYRVGRCLFPAYFQNRDGGTGLRGAVGKVHRERRIDVLECPDARGLARWIPVGDFPVVVRLHGPRTVSAIARGEPRTRLLDGIAAAERRCLKRARFHSAPSRSVVAEAQRVLGISMDDVRIIPNPISMPPRGDAPQGDVDPKEILFIGRMDRLKGFDGLIKAFARLAVEPRFGDVRLNVVGPDPGFLDDTGNTVSGETFVRQTVRDAGARARIRLQGPLPFDEVQKLRSHRRVTIIPSRFENFPNTVLEAMAAGCPVVASNAGGIPEIIQHERNGLLFRSCDWVDLAEQTGRLLSDGDLGNKLAAQARVDVNARYSPRIVAEQTVQLYTEVIDRFATGGGGRKKGQTASLAEVHTT